jgi:hypothetical protein
LHALCSQFKSPSGVAKLVAVGAEYSKFHLLPRLGKRSPLTAMTGLPADSPLVTLTLSEGARPLAVNIDALESKHAAIIEATLEALDRVHKDVTENTSAARQRGIDFRNAKVSVQPCNFSRGDVVLRGVPPRHQQVKLVLRWVDPYRITEVLSGFINILEDMTGKR